MTDDKYLKSLGRTLWLMDEKVKKLYPLADRGGVLKWAQTSQTALYDEVKIGFVEIEKLMLEKTDFEGFKARVIKWAQAYMQLCKKYQAWARKR